MNASDQPPGRAGALARATLPWLVMVAAFVHALAVSWRKWGDLLVDTGRELDLPRRLAEGQLLYRDARFYYGPLAPYVNACLYRIFGVHLDVLVWAGIVSAALMCVGLYRLARFFTPRWASAAIVVAFIYLCAFAHLYAGPIFNFVLPYTFSATYGIVVATWSLVLLIDHIRSRRALSFYGSAALLALAALSKLEVLAPAAAVHGVFVASLLVERPRRPSVYLAGYGAASATVFAVYGGLAFSVGPGLWRENLLGVVNKGSSRFVLWAMGLASPAEALRAMGISFGLISISLGLAWLATRTLGRGTLPAAFGWGLTLALALGSFIASRGWQLHVHFRALPLFMTIAIAALAVLYWRRPERRSEWLAHLLLWTFGFSALWRILLNARPHHYGFYLLPPGLVCLGVLFFDYGPRLAGSGPWSERLFAAAGLGILASSISLAYVDSRQLYALHTYELRTPRGHLRILNRWRLEGPAVRALSKLPPETRGISIPQGTGILYFAGLREGDTMSSYLPMEVVGKAGDDQLLTQWRGNPPDVVVFVGIPLAEFGSAGIGVDYATRALGWIVREYVPVTSPTSPIVIMLRRERAAPAAGSIELSPSPEPPNGRMTLKGRVLETFESGGVTFLRLRTDSSKVWVAVLQTPVRLGSEVTVADVQPGGVEEPGLRRRFDEILTGRLVSTDAPVPASTHPNKPS